VRVETMGSQKCGIVGKSQSVLIMINPIIFTRTRTWHNTGVCSPRKSVHKQSVASDQDHTCLGAGQAGRWRAY
jgi:hypothetical protein